jgi:hypothetical protein
LLAEEAGHERNPDLVFRRIVEELILIAAGRGGTGLDCVYTLNLARAFTWEKLDGQRPSIDTQKGMVQEYDSDPQVVAADLAGFVPTLESALWRV